MSILIQGMEMPKDGFITITVTSDGRVVGNSKKEIGKFEYLGNEDIANAIRVPPHGKLIDADDEIGINVTMMPGGKCKIDLIAPVIIPADKEEYDGT